MLGHPFTLALALSFDSWLRQFEGDVPAVRARADEVWGFAIDQGFAFWIGWASIMRGWATAAEGDVPGGAAQIRQGLVEWQATGSELGTSYFLYLLADVLGRAGEVQPAMDVLGEAVTATTGKVARMPSAPPSPAISIDSPNTSVRTKPGPKPNAFNVAYSRSRSRADIATVLAITAMMITIITNETRRIATTIASVMETKPS